MDFGQKIGIGLLATSITLSPLVVIGYTQSYDGNIGEVAADWLRHPSDTYQFDRMTLGCRSPRGRHAHTVRDEVVRNRTLRRQGCHDLHENEHARFATGAGLALLVVGGIVARRRL
jgi:hypothetical protein